jgi:hypothetical protein
MMELRFLDPHKIRLTKAGGGWLLLDLQDGSEPVKVKPARNFPLTDPEHYISLLTEDENEIGVIYDTKELEPRSRKALRSILDRIYFLPVIQKVNNITEEFGVLRWDVETSKGHRVFEVRGRHDIRVVTQFHLVIRDIDGNRYHIPDLRKLDRTSRHLVEVIL